MNLVIMFAAVVAAAPVDSPWRLEPLGEAGTLVCETKLRNEPVLVDVIPAREPGITLVDAKRTATVVIAADDLGPQSFKELKAIAEEIRWHLAEMSGRTVELVVGDAPKAGPVVYVRRLEVPSQTAVVRIDGDSVVVGGDGPGIGHAATYFLESLGVRYLWPGKSGKVIPKKTEIVLPKIGLECAPKFDYIRRVWCPNGQYLSSRGKDSLAKFGIDEKEFLARFREAYCDHPGNRDFWRWHGYNDADICSFGAKPSVQNQYGGGHNFNDYWKLYGKEHPDWFALQPDGTREIRGNRPRLCLSNPGLVDQVVKDTLRYFEQHPESVSASLCMPDGGRDSSCMCAECRKLDPVNAAPIKWDFYNPGRVSTNYVALTDRYLHFCNQVAERVLEKYPGKQFKIFIYAAYSRPPVKVKPHPSLVVFNVVGGFADAASVGGEVSGIAAFSAFGNPLVWRPNILRGITCQMPVNFAHQLYDDVVRFKENGVRGVSFDCCDGSFAVKGLVYYMISRALFNYDNLSYAAQLDDYCACFGKGAPFVKSYFEKIEGTFFRAVAKERGADGIIEDYPIEELQSILDQAAAATVDDPEANSRVKFLMKGLEIARAKKKHWAGWRSGDRKTFDAARKDFFRFVHDFCLEDPVALHPGEVGFKGPWVNGGPFRPLSPDL